MRKSTAPSSVSVVKRTCVRRLTLNGRKPRSDWWDCQREKGLTPRTGDGEWTSKETANLNADDPKVLEEVIRLATIEAQCSEKVRLAQRLGDLEASYQGPLIEKNQALLMN